MGRQLQAFELMSYWWCAGLWKLTGYVLLLTMMYKTVQIALKQCLWGSRVALPWLIWFSKPPQHFDISWSYVPMSKSSPAPPVVWSVGIPRSPLPIQSWEKELKEPVWLWLLSEVSVDFDDFHTWNLKHFLILKEVLHLKNSSIKSSLPVGVVVFTKKGRIYHSSVLNDKLLWEPSFICRLRTALHIAIFLLSLHLYPSPHEQFPMGIVILKM